MSRAATARKPSPSESANKRSGSASTRFGSLNNPSQGRKKGSRNKVTKFQVQAAREAFEPMAKRALAIGGKHLDKCNLDGCVSCQWWGNVAFQYHYGKPTQPIEFDIAKVRTELEELAIAAGKSVEEMEQEAQAAGLAVISQYRRTG